MPVIKMATHNAITNTAAAVLCSKTWYGSWFSSCACFNSLGFNICCNCTNDTLRFRNLSLPSRPTVRVIDALLMPYPGRSCAVVWQILTQVSMSTFHKHRKLRIEYVDRDSSVGITTRYRLDGPGIEFRPIACWDCRIESPGGHGCLCYVQTAGQSRQRNKNEAQRTRK